MSAADGCAPCCNASEEFDLSFSLSGPLPISGSRERSDYFIECEDAHGQYLAHRSANAEPDTMTYHVVDESGEVAGFISFRIIREEGKASTRIFNCVEYIYVKQGFRGRGLSTLLLAPLLQDVQVALNAATGAGRKLFVRLYSSSQPQSSGGHRVLRNLEERLLELAKRYRRVELNGRHVSWQLARARQCALEVDAADHLDCN